MKTQIIQQFQNYLAEGKIAAVTFEKKDGSIREASVRLFKEAAFASGDKNNVQPRTTRNNPDIMTMYDTGNGKWINVSRERLLSVRFGKVEANFK